MANSSGPKRSRNAANSPFDLSVGDLMAALMLIFVLLLSATLLNLQEKAELADRYKDRKVEIYDQLMKEFESDLARWNVEIDREDLIVRFKEPDILFQSGESKLKPEFIAILNDFFPRYLKILLKPEYKSGIEEIRIEGHTDNVGPYLDNVKLSQERTFAVLQHVLMNESIHGEELYWVQKKLTSNGLSYSKPIASNDTPAGKKLNRRVEFRIRTDAEKQIEKYLDSAE
jgi:outer membrane protein OmpA-like peptidoglycan-associated protein